MKKQEGRNQREKPRGEEMRRGGRDRLNKKRRVK